MAWIHITDSSLHTVSGSIRKLLVQVNAALTGTITVTDANGTVGIVTNPTVGSKFEYWRLVGPVTVQSSATCEITISTDGSTGPI